MSMRFSYVLTHEDWAFLLDSNYCNLFNVLLSPCDADVKNQVLSKTEYMEI